MHPALSIIVFTTMSGLGYGLAALLGLGLLNPAFLSSRLAHLLALALIAGGLSASTLHLGNPQRAWRAFSQWRTSWLSREGVMAIMTFVPLCISAWAALFQSRYLLLPGLLGAAGAVATVWCTAMIYASLKAVQAWHTPLTPACYLLFSAAGGSLLAALFSLSGGDDGARLMLAAAVLLLATAWTMRFFWRARAREEPAFSSRESATGLGFIGRVRPFERPHGNDSYLTREMGFRIARKHADKLFLAALILGGAVPGLTALVLSASGISGLPAMAAMLVAVTAHMVGMLVERWLFFAEAWHAVMNYYE